MQSGRAVRDIPLGALAGAVSGALGVGGGIVLVPLLVLFQKMEQKQAQATSLVMVAMAAVAGAMVYLVAGAVAWAAAAFVLIGSLVGALAGSALVQRTHNSVLQIAFAVVLVIAAVRLLWSPEQNPGLQAPSLTAGLGVALVVVGLAMGLLSAMFGIGGGIVLVPVLTSLLGFGQYVAAGTSLAVMAPTALLGAVRLTSPGLTQWDRGALLGLGGIVGGIIGARLALALPVVIVTYLFAVLMVITAVRLAIKGWNDRGETGTAPPAAARGDGRERGGAGRSAPAGDAG
ncbi:MAG: sulfite exporter TauE/SafE family protein [bacterium]